MKIFNFLAATVLSLGMLNFVSCSSKTETLHNDICEELEEAAEILQSECITWEDTQDVAKELNKIADNLYALTEKAEKDEAKLDEEKEALTKKERKELGEKFDAQTKAANSKWESAVKAFNERDSVRKSKAVQNAIKRVNSYGHL